MQTEHTDIAIIGAGPAGSVAAALLRQRGWRVTVIERSHFPRFSIGESLLPQCMESLAEADMLAPLDAAGFQVKRGVAFAEGERYGQFSFSEQYTRGWNWTWHVPRADFDQIIANEAARRGADVHFGQHIEHVDFTTPGAPRLTVGTDPDNRYILDSRFVCDASGFGRVLPRLLDLDQSTDTPTRAALFTHIADHIDASKYRRDHIRVTIHPDHPDVWYWLIAFGNGRASIGVVGDPAVIGAMRDDAAARLKTLVAQEPHMARLLARADYDSPTRALRHWARSVPRMHGQDYVLLGNAGGFIDPVFSSGVTVALKSAVLACDPIDRQLRGHTPDWQSGFETPLRDGLRVFRSFVEAWYRGALKHVFFKTDPDPEIRRMIASILAGYVWDTSNPYVAESDRRLRTLCELCARQ